MEREKTLKRMELARVGQFGMDGAEITLKDLREVKETFDGRAPVSIGHDMTKDKDWWPSFGNVVALELQESDDGVSATLSGDVMLDIVLAEAIDQGFYDGWSISIPQRGSDSKRYLHHLAFLGAVPPKIRDLKILKELRDSGAPSIEGGTDFADSFVFHKSDFAEPDKVPGEDPPADPVEPPEEAPADIPADDHKDDPDPEPVAETPAPPAASPDFSDKRMESAKKMYKGAQRARIKAELTPVVPAGMMDKVLEFGDQLCDLGQSDFSDEEDVLVARFVEIVKSIPDGRSNLTRRHDFSDARRGQDEIIDISALAQRY
jgi:hypothetical protein